MSLSGTHRFTVAVVLSSAYFKYIILYIHTARTTRPASFRARCWRRTTRVRCTCGSTSTFWRRTTLSMTSFQTTSNVCASSLTISASSPSASLLRTRYGCVDGRRSATPTQLGGQLAIWNCRYVYRCFKYCKYLLKN